MEKTTQITKLPLTVIILTHRSDERFSAALASVQFADDVLVIANQNEAAVSSYHQQYHFQVMPWNEPITDFARVRNQAIQHAQYEWVLFVDSDEEVTPASVNEIERLISHPTALGYGVRRCDVFHGKQLEYGEAGNQLLLRLGKKESMKFSGAVHEVADIAGKVEASSIVILHYSHPDIHEFIDKVSRYAHQVAATRSIGFLQLIFELLFYPPAKFIYAIVFQGGAADGWHGIVYAACMSLHSLLVRIYLYEKLFIKKP